MSKTTENFILLFARGFGAGFSPIAPGTAGSIIGVLLFLLISNLPLYFHLAFIIFFIFFSIYISHKAGIILKDPDHPQIVIDEISGFFLTLLFHKINLFTIIVGFLLFRIFDIIKPPPAKFFQVKMKNGFGCVFDDVVAGIYSSAMLFILEGVFLFYHHW